LSEEEKGLQLAKQSHSTEREAYAYMMLGQLNADIGKNDVAENDFNQAESIWSNNPSRLQQVARARWLELTRASLATLAQLPPAPKHAQVGRNGQAWAPGNVLNLLENKKFADLDKVLADAQLHRGRLANGQEEANSLFGVLADLPENSTDADWQKRLTLLQAWIAAEPTAATPHVVLASYYNNFAWKARGGDWGNKVSNQQWSDFYRRLSLGAAQLNQALKFAPLTPEWFDVAQTNFLGGGGSADVPLYNKLAAEGIKNFPDYLPIYLNKAYYLQPRWHGKGGQWVTFITQEADKIGGLEGDKFYARMVNYVKSLYEDVYKEFPKLSQSRAERGTKALQKAYPGSDFGKDK
jgi:hypothetical protein